MNEIFTANRDLFGFIVRDQLPEAARAYVNTSELSNAKQRRKDLNNKKRSISRAFIARR